MVIRIHPYLSHQKITVTPYRHQLAEKKRIIAQHLQRLLRIDWLCHNKVQKLKAEMNGFETYIFLRLGSCMSSLMSGIPPPDCIRFIWGK